MKKKEKTPEMPDTAKPSGIRGREGGQDLGGKWFFSVKTFENREEGRAQVRKMVEEKLAQGQTHRVIKELLSRLDFSRNLEGVEETLTEVLGPIEVRDPAVYLERLICYDFTNVYMSCALAIARYSYAKKISYNTDEGFFFYYPREIDKLHVLIEACVCKIVDDRFCDYASLPQMKKGFFRFYVKMMFGLSIERLEELSRARLRECGKAEVQN